MFDSAPVSTPLAHRVSAAGGATALFVAALLCLRAAPSEPATTEEVCDYLCSIGEGGALCHCTGQPPARDLPNK